MLSYCQQNWAVPDYSTCGFNYIKRTITMDNKQEKQGQKQDLQNPKEENSDTKSSKEIGGPKGPEPTRYGDWERRGRCIDF